MKVNRQQDPYMHLMIEQFFSQILGLWLFKTWNVFATRMFYLTGVGSAGGSSDGEYRLTLECPWRLEKGDEVLVGSEDYGIQAAGNVDPNWKASQMHMGHRQDDILSRLFGEVKDGEIFTRKGDFVVGAINADVFGGFRLLFSNGCVLSVFPTSTLDEGIEWMLSGKGTRLALSGGTLRKD